MRFSRLTTLGLLAAALLPLPARALLITPATLPQYSGPQNSQNLINSAIAPIIGSAVELYKAESDPFDELGALQSSYETTFLDEPDDPSGAEIEYVGGSIVTGTAWLLVKDGNHSPGWYLFNLTTLGWDGMETIVLEDFWPQRGAISHVTLYGTASVPDAANTFVLLGMAMGALGFFARRRKA